jgi:glycosyltransferase involved in cell wall biosynthesis
MKEKLDKATILVCSNYAWTVYNFRMPLIRRLKKEGYKVIVVTEFDGYENEIRLEVDMIEPLFISRKGVNPFVDIFTIIDLIRHLRKFKPDILLAFTIKPVIYSSIAAKLLRIPSIVMVTGLGTAFITNNWITRVVKKLYKFALSSVSIVFFQNVDDRDFFVQQKFVDTKVCRYTPGSGIDINKFTYSKLTNNSEITFLLIGRMLWDKGIGEFVEAAKIIKLKYPNARFQLLGPLGVQNRTAIKSTDMEAWENEGIIQYLGETDDVTKFIEKACCIVLPSYREGTSRVLLEAAAMGRPLIATDVPGCREVIEDGVTGLLCKARDYVDLSQKIEMMLKLPFDARSIMGIKGRSKIENEFRQEIVCDLYIDAIKRLGLV